MRPFDIHTWRHKQLFTQSSDKDTIEILAEIYMANLAKNKLYENISPQHYNQLRENIFKKLKAKFLDFSDDVKTNVKRTRWRRRISYYIKTKRNSKSKTR